MSATVLSATVLSEKEMKFLTANQVKVTDVLYKKIHSDPSNHGIEVVVGEYATGEQSIVFSGISEPIIETESITVIVKEGHFFKIGMEEAFEAPFFIEVKDFQISEVNAEQTIVITKYFTVGSLQPIDSFNSAQEGRSERSGEE